MTLDEYKSQIFKYDGNSNPVTYGDVMKYDLPRKTRREIERLVKKGKNPDMQDYL